MEIWDIVAQENEEINKYIVGNEEYKGWSCYKCGLGRMVFKKDNKELSIYVSDNNSWLREAWRKMKDKINEE